ncbi:MAG: 50S ribosomal protein L6 [Deltaproteobacteria bacterium]|nr:50S ribosomal protein L6 [Deltaproteobacteria bacterium]
MSRMGKLPVELDAKIKSELKEGLLTLTGPLGKMGCRIPGIVEVKIDGQQVSVLTDFEQTESRMMAGTIRSLINNNAIGVTTGFARSLDLVGVGYRAQIAGQKLTLALGFSHPVVYELPKTVQGEVEGNTKITLKSCDKQLLGQVVAEIRKYRPPEPYKGKGILYSGEVIKKKAGKTAKSAK